MSIRWTLFTLYNDDTKRLSGDLYVKADSPGSCPYESDYIRVPYRLEELNHSRWALEKGGGKSYIGDQLRLKVATENDDFFYTDANVFIPNLSDITKHKNCTDFIPEQNIINNGTFFYTDKDCKFNSYYLNVYNHLPKEDYYLCNYSILKKYPFDLKLESKKSADITIEQGIFC